VVYSLSAVLGLYLFWLGLSGHYTIMLMSIGAACAIAIVAVSKRMAVIDHEGHPVALLGRALWYWPWLIWQIVLSGLSVSRIILSPSLPISPALIRVRASQKTAAGLVTYANSITLTPGTVSVDIEDDVILVHAITEDGARDVASGGMDRMVTRFEGAGTAETAR
jgi:multicomponent Na+:H+ antiporter subunit E